MSEKTTFVINGERFEINLRDPVPEDLDPETLAVHTVIATIALEHNIKKVRFDEGKLSLLAGKTVVCDIDDTGIDLEIR